MALVLVQGEEKDFGLGDTTNTPMAPSSTPTKTLKGSAAISSPIIKNFRYSLLLAFLLVL